MRALIAALAPRQENAVNVLAVAKAAALACDPRALYFARRQAEAASAERTLATINAEYGRRRAELARAEGALEPIRVWADQFRFGPVDLVAQGPGFVDVDIDVDALRRDNESWQDAADRMRDAIWQRQREIAVIRAAPLPIDVVRARIELEIAQKAARGAPKLDLTAGRVAITWPDVSQYSPNAGNGTASDMLCHMYGASITRVLCAAAEAEIGDGGLPLAGRDRCIAQLEAELLDLEFDAESLIQAAAAEGTEIARYGRPSVEAMLQIRPGSGVAREELPLAAE
jgi:hypothetical protein